MQMQQSSLYSEPIRNIEIFYYSSSNHIYVNTVLIELISETYVAQNIIIKKTQITEPSHHTFGEAPFLSINGTNIVKKPQLWDFLVLLLGIDISRKYEFLSVAYSTEQIAAVSNLFCQNDQNPYFTFISPWRKYKKHQQLQTTKQWFRQNSQFYNYFDQNLNKEFFLYKINSLGRLIQEYKKDDFTKPEYLVLYKILVFAMMKHLKMVDDVLYRTITDVKALRQSEDEIQELLIQKKRKLAENVPLERPAPKIIPFTNVILTYLQQNPEVKKEPQQNPEYFAERQKFYQSIFKPVFVTTLFGLAVWAFK